MRRVLACLMICATLAGAGHAWADSPTDLVRDWFQRYLHREPGRDLTVYTDLLRRGASETDLQASLLGSDEYYQQARRNPRTFCSNLYADVVGRQAGAAELTQLVNRLDQLRGERLELAREVLVAQSVGNPPPANGGAIDLRTIHRLTDQLQESVELFLENVRQELQGSRQGRQLIIRGNALRDNANRLHDRIDEEPPQAGRIVQAIRDSDRAFQAIETELGNPPGTAQLSAAVARQISGTLRRLSAAAGGNVGNLPGPAPGDGYDTAAMLSLVNIIQRNTQSLIHLAGREVSLVPTHVNRDLQSLASDVNGFETLLQRGSPLPRLVSQWRNVNDEAGHLQEHFARVPQGSVMYGLWANTASRISRVSDLLQVGNPGPIPPGGPGPGGRDVVRLVDSIASELDVFLESLQPIILQSPSIPRVHSRARAFRITVLQLRETLTGRSSPEEVAATFRIASRQHDDLQALWRRATDDNSVYDPPSLDGVGRNWQLLSRALGGGGNGPEVPDAPFSSGVIPILTGYWQASDRQRVQPFIAQRDLELQLVNENGTAANGRWLSIDTIEANWPAGRLRARVGRDEIVWANGDRWRRSQLLGCWWERGRPVQAVIRENRLAFVDSQGRAGRGEMRGPLDVFDLDRQLGGRIGDGRISWQDGRIWTQPVWIAGMWVTDGQYTRILQSGQTLILFNELGQQSRGTVTSGRTIQASEWNNLVGQLDESQFRITWSNGTTWQRIR